MPPVTHDAAAYPNTPDPNTPADRQPHPEAVRA